MNEMLAEDMVHDHVLAMIRAGNTAESVASFFGLSVDAVHTLVAQPLAPHPREVTPSAPPQPWHHFPATIVFRRPNYALITMLLTVLAAASVVGWIIFSSPRYTGPVFISLWSLLCIFHAAALIHSIHAARVNRLDMRAYMMTRYTLKGSTVLRYADIVGYTKEVTKGDYCIQFLTHRGVALSIIVTPAQTENIYLSAWLRSLPGSDDTLMQSHPVKLVALLPGLALASYILLLTGWTGVQAVRDAHEAKLALQWPVTDAIVTKSVALSGGGKGCRQGLDFRYTYRLAQYRYTGGTYQFGRNCIDDAMHIAATNPVGAHLPVHYHPDRPAESVVVPGVITQNMVFDMFEMLFFMIFPVVAFRYGRTE